MKKHRPRTPSRKRPLGPKPQLGTIIAGQMFTTPDFITAQKLLMAIRDEFLLSAADPHRPVQQFQAASMAVTTLSGTLFIIERYHQSAFPGAPTPIQLVTKETPDGPETDESDPDLRA